MDEKLTKKFVVTEKVLNNDGTIRLYVSPAVIDRDNELIIPEAWELENFKKNPVLVSQHSWYGSLQNVIGRVNEVGTDEKGLWVVIEYYFGAGNDEADWAYFLAKKNQAAYSVGFIVKETASGENYVVDGKKPDRVISRAELLELSQVIIPANQDATTMQNSFVKTFKEFVAEKNEIESKKNEDSKDEQEQKTEAKAPEVSEDPMSIIKEYFENITKENKE